MNIRIPGSLWLRAVVVIAAAACLPDFAVAAIREALPAFDRQIKGFALHDAMLTGVETRTSSPIRIRRKRSLSGGRGSRIRRWHSLRGGGWHSNR